MTNTARFKKIAFAALALGLAATGEAVAAQSETIVTANQAYSAGRYPEAIELYDAAVQSGKTTAAVFHNLGNAWFRTGDFGKAVLNYERALALEPQHPEAEANLQLARDKARALELRTTSWDRMTARASASHYAIAASLGLWLAAFAVAVLLFSQRRSRILIAICVASLMLFAAAGTGLYLLEIGNRGRAVAVVTAKNIEARLATADSAGSVLALPPGSEIKILSMRGDWIYAALPNDQRGWIPARSAERVRL